MTTGMPRMFLLMAAEEGRSDGLRRIPVAMVARGFKGKQKFAVTSVDLGLIVRNFRKRATGDLVIDYDHSIEFAAGAGEPVPAAGWLKSIEDAPDANGVLWGLAQFTERATKMLLAGEYRYFSPVLVWGARDKNTGEPQGITLTSIALTNTPLLEKLPAFTFSEPGWQIDRGNAAREGSMPLTVESAKAELKDLYDQLFAEIGKLMDGGLDHRDSLIKVYEDNPDLGKRERQLMDFLKMAPTFPGQESESAIKATEAELDLKTRARMAGSNLQYHEAIKLVARENPDLDRRRTRLLRGEFPAQIELSESRAGGGDALEQLEAELDLRARARMAGTNLQYHEALKLVAREDPDLDRRRARLTRG